MTGGRALVVLHLAANRWWTGSADPTIRLVTGLRQRGHRVLLGAIPALASRRSPGIGLVGGLRLDPRAGPAALARDAFRLRRLVRAEGVDLVHVHHSHDHWLAALARPRRGGRRAPVVRTFHSLRAVRCDRLAASLYRRAAAALDAVVIAERWIIGREFTVGILQGEALPAIRIETPRSFYDYQAKYFADDTRYLIPCGLPAPAEAAMQVAALATFAATGASGWGRVDFVMGGDGVPLLLEVNTVPGMTSHSLVPMAARAAGIDFNELTWRILETSFARERT
jgi:hypothetical protein